MLLNKRWKLTIRAVVGIALTLSFVGAFAFFPTQGVKGDTSLESRVSDLERNLAVLQASVSQHHVDESGNKFPERVAVLEVRAAAIDNKLNVIIGCLATLITGFVLEFIHRIKTSSSHPKVVVSHKALATKEGEDNES